MQIKLFFTRKGFAHSLVVKIRVLRTQKMPIVSDSFYLLISYFEKSQLESHVCRFRKLDFKSL